MENFNEIILRSPKIEDEGEFLQAMNRSHSLHYPWIKAPSISQEFKNFIHRYQQETHKSFLVCDQFNHIIGVYNFNDIVRGCFQNAYLGFYANADYSGKGYMSHALKLILKKAFTELSLHRLEANIQPENSRSIYLVQNNGFRKEGYSPCYLKVNNEWEDHERWAITLEDWKRSSSLKNN